MEQEESLIDEESGIDSPPWTFEITISFEEKLHFLLTALLLATSSSILVIVTPLYIGAVNVESDAYSSLLFTVLIATLILCTLCVIYHNTASINIPRIRLVRIGVLKGVASVIILFAMDRNRVLCHIQDPLLGLCLAFSLAFYFLFCDKVMGLQRIFSSMIVAVGIFVSVDYQLCNEFRCHGNIEPTPATVSLWSWSSHLAWTLFCALGLSLWALVYALLENDIIKYKTHYVPSLLATVSRLVSSRELDHVHQDSRHDTDKPWPLLHSISSSIALAVGLVVTQLLTVILLAWTAMIRPLGKASSPLEWWHMFTSGLLSHLSTSSSVAAYAWIFALSYCIMLVSSIHFITLSESSVFTIACGSISLPIAGVWWSMFSSPNAVLVWNPELTGELVCSFLGTPIAVTGLVMLCKAHWMEVKVRKVSSPCQAT